MSISKIAESYAKALLSLAISTNTLQFVTEDIIKILKLFKKNSKLTKSLTNPILKKDVKKQIIKLELDTVNYINKNTEKFLMLLIDRSRIEIFESIGEKYLILAYKHLKIEIVDILTERSLSSEEEIEIKKQLKLLTNANEIRLVIKEEKNLLGGIVIKFGSKIIDLSLKNQFKKLATELEIKY
jgi:F-type H+-transporting ATPase subunit delta